MDSKQDWWWIKSINHHSTYPLRILGDQKYFFQFPSQMNCETQVKISGDSANTYEQLSVCVSPCVCVCVHVCVCGGRVDQWGEWNLQHLSATYLFALTSTATIIIISVMRKMPCYLLISYHLRVN